MPGVRWPLGCLLAPRPAGSPGQCATSRPPPSRVRGAQISLHPRGAVSRPRRSMSRQSAGGRGSPGLASSGRLAPHTLDRGAPQQGRTHAAGRRQQFLAAATGALLQLLPLGGAWADAPISRVEIDTTLAPDQSRYDAAGRPPPVPAALPPNCGRLPARACQRRRGAQGRGADAAEGAGRHQRQGACAPARRLPAPWARWLSQPAAGRGEAVLAADRQVPGHRQALAGGRGGQGHRQPGQRALAPGQLRCSHRGLQ